NRIARWTEHDIAFPPPQWSPMGSGFNNGVSALERVSNTYVAGGGFTLSGATTVNGVALWNESTGAWTQLHGGMNGTVLALKFYSQSGFPQRQLLVAGGDFTTAGGAAASRVAVCEQNLFDGSFSSW